MAKDKCQWMQNLMLTLTLYKVYCTYPLYFTLVTVTLIWNEKNTTLKVKKKKKKKKNLDRIFILSLLLSDVLIFHNSLGHFRTLFSISCKGNISLLLTVHSSGATQTERSVSRATVTVQGRIWLCFLALPLPRPIPLLSPTLFKEMEGISQVEMLNHKTVTQWRA
jgi:hypothetical protein